MSSPLVLHLIFCQIVGDMFNKFHSVHARISADEREEMLDVSKKKKKKQNKMPSKTQWLFQLLDRFGVTASNMQTGHHKASTKRSIVELARQWPLYFARIFPVSVSISRVLILSECYKLHNWVRVIYINVCDHRSVVINTEKWNIWPSRTRVWICFVRKTTSFRLCKP